MTFFSGMHDLQTRQQVAIALVKTAHLLDRCACPHLAATLRQRLRELELRYAALAKDGARRDAT